MEDNVFAHWLMPKEMSAFEVEQKLNGMIGTEQEWPKESGLKIMVLGFEPYEEWRDGPMYCYRAKVIY